MEAAATMVNAANQEKATTSVFTFLKIQHHDFT